jgi:exodeoxyribonuclease VII small subunit
LTVKYKQKNTPLLFQELSLCMATLGNSPESQTFTHSLQRLQQTLDRFRQETLPPEEALGLFENGLQEAKRCQSFLNDAKTRLQVLRSEASAVASEQIEEETMASSSQGAFTLPEALNRQAFRVTVEQEEVWTPESLTALLKQLQKHFQLRLNAKPIVSWRDDASGGEGVLLSDCGVVLALSQGGLLSLQAIFDASGESTVSEAQLSEWLLSVF